MIGFEFETSMPVREASRHLTPQEEAGTTPIANPPSFQQCDLHTGAPYAGAGEWARGMPKGAVLLRGADFKVTAEESGTHPWDTLEVVFEHLPENNAGRNRLIVALNEVATLFDEIAKRPHSTALTLAPALNAAAVPTPNAFVTRWGNAVGEPQVTAGVRLDRLAHFMERVGGTNADRQNPSVERFDLGYQFPREDDFLLVGNASGIARMAMIDYLKGFRGRNAHLANPFAEDYDELVGLLALITTYLVCGQRNEQYPKGIAPIMARNNLAMIFSKLHPAVQTHFSVPNRNEWIALCQSLVTYSGVDGDLNTPLFPNMANARFNTVSRRQWLDQLPQGTDLLTRFTWPVALEQTGIMSMGGLVDPATGHAGGTAGAHPGESVGTPPNTVVAPVFELRRMTKNVPYRQFMDVALGAFDWIVSVNNRLDQPYQRHVRTAQETASGRLQQT
jgi:hypothetical protein